MRIAYLVSQYPTINHTYLLREVRALRAHGFDVRVASVSSPDRHADVLTPEEAEEASRTFYIKARGIGAAVRAHLGAAVRHPAGYLRGLLYPLAAGRGDWRKTLYWFFYFVEAVIAGEWMRANGLKHAHVHYSGNVGLLLAKVFPVTTSLTLHGMQEFIDPEGQRMPEKIRESLFVRTISMYGRSQTLRLCSHHQWGKVELAPLGVDLSRFVPAGVRRNGNGFDLLCVGRLAPEKGQTVLVAAVDKLVSEGRRVRLHLVGDGQDRQGLESEVRLRRLSANVVFHGFVPHEELRGVYGSMDAFVLPSFLEGLPVVLMEAMAMELACIASNITGVPELIRDGLDGLLVPASDVEGLAQAIARLMDDPALAARLGRAAREKVLREYDLDRNMERLAGIFRKRLGAVSAISNPTELQLTR